MHSLQIVEELRGEARYPHRVRLVEVVTPAHPHAPVDDAFGLARRVPDVEELVDQLLEDAPGEADARSENAREVQLPREAQEDGGGGNDRVGAVRTQLVGIAPFAVRHGAQFLEERSRRRNVDGAAATFRRTQLEERLHVPARSDERTSTLPRRGSASPRARSIASSSKRSRARSTVLTPFRYPSSMRTVPRGSDIAKAVSPLSRSVSSVDPPPTSTRSARRSATGMRRVTAS